MISAAVEMVEVLATGDLDQSGVLEWGAPVPSFGDVRKSELATIGINPSAREFQSDSGLELEGDQRRLPTLRSLGLRSWSQASSSDLLTIVDESSQYFDRRPYDRWFGVLESILPMSYYGRRASACHLDLVPFATREKWSAVSPAARNVLMRASQRFLATLLRTSSVSTLVLNGAAVVRGFEALAGQTFEKMERADWALSSASSRPVPGVAIVGRVDTVAGRALGRSILVLGYNHNLQSSFGVSTSVRQKIASWIEDRHGRES